MWAKFIKNEGDNKDKYPYIFVSPYMCRSYTEEELIDLKNEINEILNTKHHE